MAENNVEISIRCPKCNSSDVTVCENSKGFYEVMGCYNCGYNKECELEG